MCYSEEVVAKRPQKSPREAGFLGNCWSLVTVPQQRCFTVYRIVELGAAAGPFATTTAFFVLFGVVSGLAGIALQPAPSHASTTGIFDTSAGTAAAASFMGAYSQASTAPAVANATTARAVAM
jgi:hypothetical protein